MTGKEIRAYLIDHNDRETAEASGVPFHVIFCFRRRMGIESYQSRRTKQRTVDMEGLLRQGKGYREIVKEMKLTHSSRIWRMYAGARDKILKKAKNNSADLQPFSDMAPPIRNK